MKIKTQLITYIENANTPRKKKNLVKINTILTFIENANLSEKELNDLEREVELYNLSNHENMSSRSINKKFRTLQSFVNKRFSFTHKGHYTAFFMSIGMALGLSIGSAVFDPTIGLSTGMMFGLFIGLLIGRIKDQRAEKENLVYVLKK